MFSMLAVLVYLAAMALPVWLLHRFGSQLWLWHGVAIAVAVFLALSQLP